MTLAEEVVDASVIGAAFFNEAASASARAWLISAPRLIAPDLVYAEIASIAAKKVWRGEASTEAGARAIDAIDATYLALAERRETRLVTLDRKLADRARQAGVDHLLRELKP